MALSYVRIFADTSGAVDMLSDAEAGRLFKAVLHWIAGEAQELPGQEKFVFAMLKAQFERDAASYDSYVEKQRENGKKHEHFFHSSPPIVVSTFKISGMAIPSAQTVPKSSSAAAEALCAESLHKSEEILVTKEMATHFKMGFT